MKRDKKNRNEERKQGKTIGKNDDRIREGEKRDKIQE